MLIKKRVCDESFGTITSRTSITAPETKTTGALKFGVYYFLSVSPSDTEEKDMSSKLAKFSIQVNAIAPGFAIRL
jgi:hypothetical protein